MHHTMIQVVAPTESLPSGVCALSSPMARKEPGAPCTNCVACRGSTWTASDSLITCADQ